MVFALCLQLSSLVHAFNVLVLCHYGSSLMIGKFLVTREEEKEEEKEEDKNRLHIVDSREQTVKLQHELNNP